MARPRCDPAPRGLPRRSARTGRPALGRRAAWCAVALWSFCFLGATVTDATPLGAGGARLVGSADFVRALRGGPREARAAPRGECMTVLRHHAVRWLSTTLFAALVACQSGTPPGADAPDPSPAPGDPPPPPPPDDEVPVSVPPNTIAPETAALTGRVYDPLTGAPISGALVTVDETEKIRTNASGDFAVVATFDEGVLHRLTVTAEGFAALETLVVASPGKNVGLDLPLSSRAAGPLRAAASTVIATEGAPANRVHFWNTSASAFRWRLGALPPWLHASPSEGTLAAGASAMLEVSVAEDAVGAGQLARVTGIPIEVFDPSAGGASLTRGDQETAVEYAVQLMLIIIACMQAFTPEPGPVVDPTCDDGNPCTLDVRYPDNGPYAAISGCDNVSAPPQTAGLPCDDANVCTSGDVCSAATGVCGGTSCSDENDDPLDDCPLACSAPVCGDRLVSHATEQCDDGNDDDTDACRNDCALARCHDGVVHAGVEECDDGNLDVHDACTTFCRVARCGDREVQTGVEECDGTLDDQGACTRSCRAARCGDGLVRRNVEVCDDGNEDDTDACRNDCTAARCGDGVAEAGVEPCDDGNAVDGDGCNADCTPTRCGDGLLAESEECDDGNAVDGDGCDASCRLVCGAEIDLASDPLHCGACGHSCLGAACTDGLCAPDVVATGLTLDVKFLAADATHVYWSEALRVMRANLETLAVEEVATGQCFPQGIAVDETHVYWANGWQGCGGAEDLGIVRKPKESARDEGLELLAVGMQPFGLTLAGDDVVWTDGALGGVLRRAKDGTGEVETLVTGETGLFEIEAGDGMLYWTTGVLCDAGCEESPPTGGGALRRRNEASGIVMTLAEGQSAPAYLALSGDRAYWGNSHPYGPYGSSLMTMPLGGGTKEVLWSSPPGGQQDVLGLDVRGRHAYWAAVNAGVYRRRTDGLDDAILVYRPSQGFVWGLIATDRHVLFGLAGGPNGPELLRVAR